MSPTDHKPKNGLFRAMGSIEPSLSKGHRGRVIKLVPPNMDTFEGEGVWRMSTKAAKNVRDSAVGSSTEGAGHHGIISQIIMI